MPDQIKVIDVFPQILGMMDEGDVKKEGFSSLEEFQSEWRDIYGTFFEEDLVWVVEFAYICPTDESEC